VKEWFKDWFNTKEYLNVYKHRNEEDAKELVSLIFENIEINLPGNVLDLACGPGRHSILFAQKGFNVTAVDLSKNLLRVAKAAAAKANVKINFVEADLRNLCIKSRFNLVLNLFTSFGYFEDDKENFKLFNKAFYYLDKDGYFVLDFFNKNYIEKNIVPLSKDIMDGEIIIQRRKIEGKRVIKKITIIKDGIEKHFMESVRMFDKDELLKEMINIGFEIKKIFGGIRGRNFDLETSPRIIIIAQK
jgi:SAM-dependent methyltransferase